MQSNAIHDNIITLPVKSHPSKKNDHSMGIDLNKLLLYLRSEIFQKFIRNDILAFEHYCENESKTLLKEHNYHASLISGIVIEPKLAEILEEPVVQEILAEINQNPGLGESILFQLNFWKKEASK